MLKALFIDIDDTVFSTTEFVSRARERAVDAMLARGLQSERESVLSELEAVVAEFGSNDDSHFDRLLKRLPAQATADANRALLVMAGVIAYHETKWREVQIHREARELLEFLARSPLRLGVITAGLTGKQMEKILRLGLDTYLDRRLIFITDEVGVAKSNPQLYRMAAAAAGVDPGEAMHVGDNPAHDVDPAKQAGFLVTWHRHGKYADDRPTETPDHEIHALAELRPILENDYGIRAG